MKGKWIIAYLLKWPSYIKYQLRIAKRPYFLTFNLTDRCNSHCVMCNFWKNKKKGYELSPDDIKAILKQNVMKDVKYIALTGGEIFMRSDIPEIVDIIFKTTGVKPHLGTNGLFLKRLDDLLSTRKNKIGGVMISVDGLGEVHDKIRGKGTFDTTEQAIKLVKEKHKIQPTINMTLSNYNYDKLIETYDHYKDYIFTYKIAKKSKLHFGDNDDMDFGLDEKQIKRILKDSEQIPDKNLYDIFLDDWALHGRRPLPCYAGITSMVINQDGTIQPCIHKPSLGNTRDGDINKVWSSKKAKKFVKTHKSCQDCYERCTVETFGIDLPKWVIKSKFKNLKKK